jgi:hypothetical protein
MIELPLILIAGVLGSSHCVGMCGPFALAIGAGSRSISSNLARQLAYSAGRVFTYATFGAVAGFAGLRLVQWMPSFINVPAVLAMLAGALLLYQGLCAAGVLRKRPVSGAGGPCLSGTFVATFLSSAGWPNAFLAGLFSGMLPCALVYGFVTLAASSGNLFSGMAVMAAFGVGTVPVMVGTGCGGLLLRVAARRRLFQAAAWCVVVTGLVSMARGFGFLHLTGWLDAAGCPLCR